MSDLLRDKWDQRHRSKAGEIPPVAFVLEDNGHLLPSAGTALDLACGRGGNALFLAQAGLQVSAWDLSPVAIAELQSLAKQQGLDISAEVRDVVSLPPGPGCFDVIVVSYFLERSLAPLICAALRPGGLLFYQTFVRDKVAQTGPMNPQYLLAENELLELFGALRLRVYREEGRIGDPGRGLRNEAILVGQRPES